MLIVLSGVIGAGKTSLTKILAKHLHTHAFLEPVKNNPVLPRFYKGNKLVSEGKWKTNPYTFLLQIYFLNLRFKMMKEAMWNDNNVLDRSIFEDSLFMRLNYDMGHTTKEEWEVYQALLKNMMEELPYAAHKKAPDLMVYIKMDYPTMIKHIEKRDRPYEQPKNDKNLIGYYKKLLQYYAQWIKQYDKSRVIVIDGTRYDFVNNKSDRETVINMIDDTLSDIRFDQMIDRGEYPHTIIPDKHKLPRVIHKYLKEVNANG